MAAPTETTIRTQISNCVRILEETFDFGNANSPNLIDLSDDAIESLEGDYSEQVAAGVAAFRARVAAAFQEGRRMLDGLLLAYAKLKGFPDRDPQAILDRLFDDFHDNSESVQERNFTFGSPSAGGSNVGDGTLHRLTTDDRGYDTEGKHAEAMEAVCVADANSGAFEHEEVFEFRGAARSKDALDLAGSGVVQRVSALSGRVTSRILSNPSFDQLNGSSISSLTSVPGWSVENAIGNCELYESAVYRGFVGDGGTKRALRLTATEKVSQSLTARRFRFNPDVPYYCQIAYNRAELSGSGTLVLRLGASSDSVAVSAQTGWNILKIPLGTGNWLRSLNEETLDVEIDWTRSAGDILIDDVILAPFSRVDGSWYAIVGAGDADNRFLLHDEFTWTDSEVGAKIQKWLWLLYDRILPPSATPTFSDPS